MKNKIIIVVIVCILVSLGVGVSFFGNNSLVNESTQTNENSNIDDIENDEIEENSSVDVTEEDNGGLTEEETEYLEELYGRKLTDEEKKELDEGIKSGEYEIQIPEEDSSEEDYENTIKYNEDYDLYIGVTLSKDTHEFSGFTDYGFIKVGSENPSKQSKESVEGQELQEILDYMYSHPSNTLPSEEEMGIKLESLDYAKISECWNGLGLPEDIKKFEKTMIDG